MTKEERLAYLKKAYKKYPKWLKGKPYISKNLQVAIWENEKGFFDKDETVELPEQIESISNEMLVSDSPDYTEFRQGAEHASVAVRCVMRASANRSFDIPVALRAWHHSLGFKEFSCVHGIRLSKQEKAFGILEHKEKVHRDASLLYWHKVRNRND